MENISYIYIHIYIYIFYIYFLIGSQCSSGCCCSISSVILIVSSIDLGGSLDNTRIDDQIILFNGIN